MIDNNHTPTTEEIKKRASSPKYERYDRRKTIVQFLEVEFDRWLARYRESVIDEVEDHLVSRDQFTERTLDVIDELRDKA